MSLDDENNYDAVEDAGKGTMRKILIIRKVYVLSRYAMRKLHLL